MNPIIKDWKFAHSLCFC